MDPNGIKPSPGYRTSEFWLNFLAMVLGFLIASGVFVDGHVALKIAGLALSALSALGYTGSRSKAKLAASLERSSLGKPEAPVESSEPKKKK